MPADAVRNQHVFPESESEPAPLQLPVVTAVTDAGATQQRFGVKWNDDDIGRAAADRLNWDTTLPKNAVKVSVSNGWATLTGEVTWQFQCVAAAQDVCGLWGVAGVSNQITLKLRVGTFISDRFLLGS